MWNELGFALAVFRREWFGFRFDYFKCVYEKLAVMLELVFSDDVLVCLIDFTDCLPM
jgi:hypothetical protein